MPALAVVPRRAERPEIRVLLPGRDVAFDICHARHAWEFCDGCLRAIARELAREMDWSLETALNRTTANYHAELGEANCSYGRARDLQLMVATMCYSHIRGASADVEDTLFALLDERLPVARVQGPGVRVQGKAIEPLAPRWQRVVLAAALAWVATVVLVAVLLLRGVL